MIKDIPLGTMEGRLLPPINGQIQLFPGEDWGKEFLLARECGIDAIEMIYDVHELNHNPLCTIQGIQALRAVSVKYGIRVCSVCADYFMRKGKTFVYVSDTEREENIKALVALTRNCYALGVKYLVMPFVDASAIKTDDEMRVIRKVFKYVIRETRDFPVTYAIETSLFADDIVSFVEGIQSPRIKINYDTGNSTSLGYELDYEINMLGDLIVGVHIKDRKVGGGSCVLGSGDTDFDAAFQALARNNFRNLFILEAQRDGDEVETIKKYVGFVKGMIEKYY